VSPTLVLKGLLCVGSTLSGCLLVPCALVSDRVCVVLLFAAVTSLGLATPHYFPVIGSFGSILALLLNGFVVQATGGFVLGFRARGGSRFDRRALLGLCGRSNPANRVVAS
jgi:hypothetical protein